MSLRRQGSMVPTLSDAELHQLFHEMDEDGNGTIDLAEWSVGVLLMFGEDGDMPMDDAEFTAEMNKMLAALRATA